MSTQVELVVDAHATDRGRLPLEQRRAGALLGRHHGLQSCTSTIPRVERDRVMEIGQPVGTVVVRSSGGLMLALKDGFAAFDPASGELTLLDDPEAAPAGEPLQRRQVRSRRPVLGRHHGHRSGGGSRRPLLHGHGPERSQDAGRASASPTASSGAWTAPGCTSSTPSGTMCWPTTTMWRRANISNERIAFRGPPRGRAARRHGHRCGRACCGSPTSTGRRCAAGIPTAARSCRPSICPSPG